MTELIRAFLAPPLPYNHRAELANAQFMLKEDYVDWVWSRHRVPSTAYSVGKWPFIRRENNVVRMEGRR